MPYLTLPGTQFYYEEAGQGRPPLVFVHGVASAHDDWQAQVAVFRPRHGPTAIQHSRIAYGDHSCFSV